jgi:hypothetical protein
MKQSYNKLNFSNLEEIAASLTADLIDLRLPRLKNLRAATFGSCFAVNFAKALQAKGAQAGTLQIAEDVNTPLANLVILDYVLRGEDSSYYEYYLGLAAHEQFRNTQRQHIIELFKAANTVVFTAGVGAAWKHRDSGKIHLLPNVSELRHYTTVFPTVSEQTQYLRGILACIREINPTAPVLFTLSPVPLARDACTCITFLPLSSSAGLARIRIGDFSVRMA